MEKTLKKILLIFLIIFIVLFLAILALFGYMMYEAKTFSISEVEIDGLPGTIVLLTDLHAREENIEFLQKVYEKVNEIDPDMVLIAGDFMDGFQDEMQYQKYLADIKAPKYAVLGNHDYGAGVGAGPFDEKEKELWNDTDLSVDGYDVSALDDGKNDFNLADDLMAELAKNGVKVFRNEFEFININGKEILLVGLDDCLAGQTKLPDYPDADFTVFMMHEPECRADWDYDLLLAGHTHGGQMDLPIIGIPEEWYGYYAFAGRIDEPGKTVYISRGVGTWPYIDKLDMRFRRPPEIVILKPKD
ncbi:metallophosphoesterase [Patescibacteria group bacterium]|nr:metallophosphoesterase [Patescibacteria group bacterium]MBU1674035.1 metallophosphoesterase [Patescibacteria group bacterium]MBU1963183.1 metallophosphoesterase [Patescibacteria group bacterium]